MSASDRVFARIELAEARANAAEAERDRYREALEAIDNLATSNADHSFAIAQAALDGENNELL